MSEAIYENLVLFDKLFLVPTENLIQLLKLNQKSSHINTGGGDPDG